jgi:hypothetical protein
MLQKMGWNSGKTLGQTGDQGLIEPVSVPSVLIYSLRFVRRDPTYLLFHVRENFEHYFISTESCKINRYCKDG